MSGRSRRYYFPRLLVLLYFLQLKLSSVEAALPVPHQLEDKNSIEGKHLRIAVVDVTIIKQYFYIYSNW